MLCTTLAFDWGMEAKRAAALLAREHDAMGPESEVLLHPALHGIQEADPEAPSLAPSGALA
jgi:hypothetical protein